MNEPPQRPHRHQAPEEIRTLVIEDNSGDAALIRKLLSQCQHPRFEVEICNSFRAGLESLENRQFDVVLLDLSLPDSPTPLESLGGVQDMAPKTPIILLTGLDDPELATKIVRLGAQDYLVKGEVTASLLVRSIRYAIERKNTEDALRTSEERYALAVLGANDGLWDWDLQHNRIYFSPRWREIVGCPSDGFDATVESWFNRIHSDDLERFRWELDSHLRGETAHLESEYRIRFGENEHRWVSTRGLALRNAKGIPVRMAGSLSDITVRKRAEEDLARAALHDSLTGLPNRALFLDRLTVAIAHARRRDDYLFAVLFFDLDRFKNINDSLGHAVGDQLLVSIARRLEALLRPSDRVARLGGDEFAIFTDDLTEPSDANRVATRVLHDLAIPHDLDGHEVYTSASIGITLSNPDYLRPEDMLRDADIAMYRAKSTGRARYMAFDPEMHKRAIHQLEIENDLRRAVEKNELLLHYQPIVHLETGRIEGFEALVRWRHPEKGLLYPEDFIPVAEETGAILPIGRWVLDGACRQIAQWQKRYAAYGPICLSVNLSGPELIHHDLVSQVRQIIARSSLERGSLRLELTESMLLQNFELVFDRLEELKELAVKLHLDDFGTGYCSLSYLQRLPTDTLKIDRSFVTEIASESDAGHIIEAIVQLARRLGISVSAEGLETKEQVERVRGLACNYGQGYYFSEPLDPATAEQLLATGAPLLPN